MLHIVRCPYHTDPKTYVTEKTHPISAGRQKSKRVTISTNASLIIKFIWFVYVCLCLRAMVMHFPIQIGQKRLNLTKASSMTIFMPHIRIIQFIPFFPLSFESNISTCKCITFNALALVHMANVFDSELTEQAI